MLYKRPRSRETVRLLLYDDKHQGETADTRLTTGAKLVWSIDGSLSTTSDHPHHPGQDFK